MKKSLGSPDAEGWESLPYGIPYHTHQSYRPCQRTSYHATDAMGTFHSHIPMIIYHIIVQMHTWHPFFVVCLASPKMVCGKIFA